MLTNRGRVGTLCCFHVEAPLCHASREQSRPCGIRRAVLLMRMGLGSRRIGAIAYSADGIYEHKTHDHKLRF